jgi:hypothetical protein
MRVRERLGDYPTVKLSVEEVARYAKEADARAVEAEALGRRSTRRPEPQGDPDIEVTVELAEAGELSLEGINDRSSPNGAGKAGDRSDIHFVPREGEGAPLSGIPLGGIPCVVAAKEDLSWFQLDETAHVVLAMIDGESTVEDIVATLSLPRMSTLAILRDLGTHGVIEFH